MKRFKDYMKEDVPANAMGAAGISGAESAVNVGVAGIDSVMTGIVRRKPPAMFGGKAVFKVPSDRYMKSIQGKRKFEHYSSYVGRDELGESIREYIKENPNAPVILEDEKTGAMIYLKYGKKHR